MLIRSAACWPSPPPGPPPEAEKESLVAKWPKIERTGPIYTVNEPLNHDLSDPGFEGVLARGVRKTRQNTTKHD